jgi:hypothetical protein
MNMKSCTYTSTMLYFFLDALRLSCSLWFTSHEQTEAVSVLKYLLSCSQEQIYFP